jgi:hypothetical protein
LPGYFADPSCRKFGDTYFIYATPDGWDVGKGPAGVWTSRDFVNWSYHPMNWPATEFKWAPSVVEYNGTYYMYTSVPCMIYGAVAESPYGPWTNMIKGGGPMIPDQTPRETIVLDGEAFIDDDNQVYMWYSTWWRPTAVKLNPDMHTFADKPIQYFKNPYNTNPPMGIVEHCMEAPYVIKRNGIYYLMYSDLFCQDSSYNVKYSTGPSTMGPWTYDPDKNPILETSDDGTVDGPGHHTILEDGDEIYIVYHRHDNPHHPDGAHRQVCIDKLYFTPNGSIEKVRPSHMGVGYLAPSTKRDTNLALGRPATASSMMGAEFIPAYAVDRNNGTLWKADSFTFPQWLQVDLGSNCAVKRIETAFQYAQNMYRYLIEYSSDGKTWKTYTDRRENNAVGVMIDTKEVTGRYFRITIFGHTTQRPDQVAAIWGFSVYDGIDRPNQAPEIHVKQDVTLTRRFPSITLSGTVYDDGLPYGPFSVRWSKVSGPGTVEIEHADRVRTKMNFTEQGDYVLKLEATDGVLTNAETITVSIIPPDEWIVWYTFDNDNGSIVTDKTRNHQHAVLRNGATHCLGPAGSGALFDGRDDFLDVPELGTPQNLTLATWINVHTLAGQQNILCAGGEGEEGLIISVNEAGELCFSAAGHGKVSSGTVFTPETLGTWQHAAVVYAREAGRISFYWNGVKQAEKEYSCDAQLSLAGDLRIAGAKKDTRGLDGEIDDFRLYDMVLPAAEISKLADVPPPVGIDAVQMLADGTSITLLARPVVYAPQNPLNNERTTNFFYVSDPDGRHGIRVVDAPTQKNNIPENTCVSFSGTMQTAPSGERYICLDSRLNIGAPRVIEGVTVPVRKILNGRDAAGMLVTVKGVARRGKPDSRRFTLRDSSTGRELTVLIPEGINVRKFADGNTVRITGVISLDGGTAAHARRVVLLKSLERITPPPAPGLAFYSFDKKDGDIVKDSSSNDMHAHAVNNPQIVPGKIGNALTFDGEKTYVEVPDLGIEMGATVAVWLNMNSYGRDDLAASILHCDGWDWCDLHAMVGKENGAISYCLNSIGDMKSEFKFTPEQFGRWVHVALVYDGTAGKMQIYVHGKLDSSRDIAAGRPINLNGIKIGSWGSHSRLFDGTMDEFRIYDRVLNAKEIRQLAKGR